jgi:hypothetical protein
LNLSARLRADLRQQRLHIHIIGARSMSQGLFDVFLDLPYQFIRNRALCHDQGLGLVNALLDESERQLDALGWRRCQHHANVFSRKLYRVQQITGKALAAGPHESAAQYNDCQCGRQR